MSKKMVKVLPLSMLSQCKLHHVVHVSCRVHDVLPVQQTIYTVLDFFTELTILELCMSLYFLCHVLWPEVSVTF